MTTELGTPAISIRSTAVGRYRWVICALLFFATTVNYIDRQILSLLKPILDNELRWTNEEFGMVNAAFQFAYAIGHPKPLSVHIDTFGTHTADEEAIERAVLATFSFTPADIIKQLNLLRPIYSKTTNYGHFGKIDDPDITWESANKAEELKKAAK